MYLLQMMDANVTFVHLFLGFAKGIALAWVYGKNLYPYLEYKNIFR